MSGKKLSNFFHYIPTCRTFICRLIFLFIVWELRQYTVNLKELQRNIQSIDIMNIFLRCQQEFLGPSTTIFYKILFKNVVFSIIVLRE